MALGVALLLALLAVPSERSDGGGGPDPKGADSGSTRPERGDGRAGAESRDVQGEPRDGGASAESKGDEELIRHLDELKDLELLENLELFDPGPESR
jgi:hypothetical protein